MLVFMYRITMKQLNKILIFASLVISANLYSARLRSEELHRGTAAEKPKFGLFSKISKKYKAYKKAKKEKKEKEEQDKILDRIFGYNLNHDWDDAYDHNYQIIDLQYLIKENPWALEATYLSMATKQVAPMDAFGIKSHLDQLKHPITLLQRAIGNFQFFPWINCVKKIETLLNLGANINIKDRSGNTPILNILDVVPPEPSMMKPLLCWIPIVFKILLDKKADLTVKNKFGETVTTKINKLPAQYAKIIFGLIAEIHTKPEARKILQQKLPSDLCNLIDEYIEIKDYRKLELDIDAKEKLAEYASFYE